MSNNISEQDPNAGNSRRLWVV